ncbi:hypothetical protein PRZ48_002418 [Zasmidium cellare]|uniref:Uncharacterized protein n=1 Tax=Zasmidium cellare TaxID=395010 RepID=A0ABR0F5B6_ZASCE|nr:hypothetical protein PRZ48_002418 [Zasmidium cellare]
MNGGNGRAPTGAPTAPRSMRGRGGDQPPQKTFFRVCQRQNCGNPLDEDDLTGVCKPCRRQDRDVVRERQRSQQMRSSNSLGGYAGAGQQTQQARSPPTTAPAPTLPPAPLSETEALRSLLAQQMAYNVAYQGQIAAAAARDPGNPLLQALLNSNQQQQTTAPPAPASSASRTRSRSPTDGSREQYRQRNDPGRGTTDRRRSDSPRPRDNEPGRRRGMAPSGQANYETRNPEIMDEKPCSWLGRSRKRTRRMTGLSKKEEDGDEDEEEAIKKEKDDDEDQVIKKEEENE